MSHFSNNEDSFELMTLEENLSSDFAGDVYKGLTAPQKSIPCVYFYDERGSQLFEEITSLAEYYPTRAETEILKSCAEDIAAFASSNSMLVELGSGSSIKTRHLIKAFLNRFQTLDYVPIDISESILHESAIELEQTFSSLNVNPVVALYEEAFEKLRETINPKFVIWLGSSIGNYNKSEAAHFLRLLRSQMSNSDQLLLGIDLIKDKQTLENAYNDSAGITAEFNLNLLHRMNNELGANFNLNNFRHSAVFNKHMGRIEMYIESLVEQIVFIEELNLEISLKKNERIHTENSNKFTQGDIENLVESAGFTLKKQWFDSQKYFSLNLLSAPNN